MSTSTLPRPARSRRTRLGLTALALAGAAAISASPAAQAAPSAGSRTVATASVEATTDFGYLTKISRYRGVDRLTLDRAILLIGEEARQERIKRGLDPYAPDYYVVNDNPKLRTFPISPSVKVRGSQALTGSPELEAVSLRRLKAFLATEPQLRKSTPFVLELDARGRVTRITEQYLA